MKTIISLKCPMCGGPVKEGDSNCDFCGTTYFVTSIEELSPENMKGDVIEKSIAKWKMILKEDSENGEANYALGLYYLNKKLMDASITYLRKASIILAEEPMVHFNLGIALFDDGNTLLISSEYAEAIKEMDYAIKLNPEFNEAVSFKHFFLGRKLDEVDNIEALNEYKKALQYYPNNPTFQNNIGLCCLHNKNYNDANRHFQKSIDLDNSSPLPFLNLSLLCYNTGKYEEGIRYGKKAVRRLKTSHPPKNQGMAYNNLALNQWKIKDYDNAVANLKKAISVNPTEPLHRNNLHNITMSRKSGCFIATAAYGTPLASEIDVLRRWRDQSLSNFMGGRSFISTYYRFSPKIASLIEKSIFLKKVTRIILKPLVALLSKFYLAVAV